jgi:hypothetical protein
VGPRPSVKAVEKRKTFPVPDIELRSSSSWTASEIDYNRLIKHIINLNISLLIVKEVDAFSNDFALRS